MKVVIEVVATNTSTGHVAVSQETVDVGAPIGNEKENLEYVKRLKQTFRDNNSMEPRKVGDILIIRNFNFFV